MNNVANNDSVKLAVILHHGVLRMQPSCAMNASADMPGARVLEQLWAQVTL